MEHTDRQEGLKKLNKLIKDIRIAMMTTVMEDGSLRSRPMATQENEFDGDLWFFTQASAPKVDDVQQDQHVNITYANPDDQVYVSVSGTGQIVRDRKKMEELWNPFLKAWFPQGLEDPDIALIKVNAQYAEYWDTGSSKMVQLIGTIKATLTGQQYDPGENKKIQLGG